jgi:branched-chain amino acid transport system permease protein
MLQLLNTILIGITSGSIYSLMAVALVLVWRSTRVVNFAQASLALFSTYVGYEVVSKIGNYWIALPIAVLVGALFSALIEIVFIRRLSKLEQSAPIAAVAPIIVTLGLMGLVRAVIAFIWGGQDVTIKAPLSNIGYSIGEKTLVFSPMKLMILISATTLVLLMSFLFQRTNVGLALRASAFAPDIAKLAGIKVDAIRTLGWALSGGVGAVAGLLQTANGSGSISPDSIEFSLLLISGFISAVIGGLDSLVGAILGGLVLGILVSFVLMYINGGLFFIAPLVILILVLMLRPQGLFGLKAGRSA